MAGVFPPTLGTRARSARVQFTFNELPRVFKVMHITFKCTISFKMTISESNRYFSLGIFHCDWLSKLRKIEAQFLFISYWEKSHFFPEKVGEFKGKQNKIKKIYNVFKHLQTVPYIFWSHKPDDQVRIPIENKIFFFRFSVCSARLFYNKETFQNCFFSSAHKGS